MAATTSPATRPVSPMRLGDPLGGAAVHPRAARRGLEGGHAPGEERGDDPGEHVAGAGGGEQRRRRSGSARSGPAADAGSAITVPGPFSSTTAPRAVGQAAGRGDPVVADRLARRGARTRRRGA